MDEKTFMDRYMTAFSAFTDAQSRGENPADILESMKKTGVVNPSDKDMDSMSGPVSNKDMEFMSDPSMDADRTRGFSQPLPDNRNPTIMNEQPYIPPVEKISPMGSEDSLGSEMGALRGPVSDKEIKMMQDMQPSGSLVNNVTDFLINLGRKVGQ